MNIIKPILFLFVLILVSCSDDEPMVAETVIDKIEGTHDGLYEEIACSFFQTVLLSDSGSSLDITSTSDSTIDVQLKYTEDGIGDVFDFTATITADSMLTSPEFEKDDLTYTANIFLKEDSKVSVLMSNGCSIGTSLALTNRFTED